MIDYNYVVRVTGLDRDMIKDFQKTISCNRLQFEKWFRDVEKLNFVKGLMEENLTTEGEYKYGLKVKLLLMQFLIN